MRYNNLVRVSRVRRKFSSVASELNYLNDRISYWWYVRRSQPDACRHSKRFNELLATCGTDDGSITLQEHWALLHEVSGNLKMAIAHREHEVLLIQSLLLIEGPIGGIDCQLLATRFVILANLYARIGNQTKSCEWFGLAKALGRAYGFDVEMCDNPRMCIKRAESPQSAMGNRGREPLTLTQPEGK